MTLLDLSNITHTAGKIGSVTPIHVLPVVAGDTIDFNAAAVLEMRAYKRGIVLDAQVDVATFFVPHRHIYGDSWIDYLREGRDTVVTFPERSTSHIPRFLPWCERQTELPAWLTDSYFRIWSRYYRPPNQGIAEINELPSQLPVEWREFGWPAANLPAIWNSGVKTQPTAAQRELDVSGGQLDMIDLADKANEYASALDRDWQGNYYTDLLKTIWGGSASKDADQRPTLVWHDSQNTSGQNIYGTGGTNLAANAGRSHAVINHRFPRRFFPEHGTLMTLACLRFEPVNVKEMHYLANSGKTGYADFACDPRFISGQAPVQHNVQDFFETAQTTQLMYQPHSQWWRMQPNWVSLNISDLKGYPYATEVPSNDDQTVLVNMSDFDDIFTGGDQFHWECRTGIDLNVNRAIPSPMQTAYNGAP